MVAVIVRNSAAFLSIFLRQLVLQDYPKRLTTLYFRTNDNLDNTTGILQAFAARHRSVYAGVELDARSLLGGDAIAVSSTEGGLRSKLNFEGKWSASKLTVMGRLRQRALERAQELGVHGLVMVDADNFFVSGTLSRMVELSASLQVVSPMLFQRTIDPRVSTPLWMSAHLDYQRTEQGNYVWIKVRGSLVTVSWPVA